MKELSLHILDIAKNSTKAGAENVLISLVEEDDVRTLTIKDDGCGMDEEFLKTVTDPFTTTRTTRPVGMGLSLLKLAAEQADGGLSISSQTGEGHGTTVCATFKISHLDCVPVGDVAGTMVTLIQGSPDVDFTLYWKTAQGIKELSTIEMREILDGVPLDTPEVLTWISDIIKEPF